MALVVKVILHLLLLIWPLWVLMAPMVFDDPVSVKKPGNWVFFIVILTYPILVGLLAVRLEWRLFFLSPKVLLVVLVMLSLAVVSLYGIPGKVTKMVQGIPLGEQQGYYASTKQVYFDSNPVPGADPTTFAVLNEGPYLESLYARDANRVYLKGQVIEQADPKTFEILGSSQYTKDVNHVYYNDTVTVLEASTVELLEGAPAYAKDTQVVLHQGIPLSDADPKTFTVLDAATFSIGKDASHIFMRSETILPQADPQSFIVLDKRYAKDKDHVYWYNRTSDRSGFTIVEGADPATFEARWDSERQIDAYDRNHTYRDGVAQS